MYSSFNFPFDTCEKNTNGLIAQPYSVGVNFISSTVIFYYLLQCKTFPSRLFLFSLLLVAGFHTFSHAVHLHGIFSQTFVVHFLAFFSNFCFLYLFANISGTIPDLLYTIFLAVVVLFDLFAFYFLDFIFYFASQIVFFLSVLCWYYPILPKKLQNVIQIIFGLTILIYIAFLNERFNCSTMMSIFPGFPFHIIIETLGLVVFYLLSKTIANYN